MGFMDTLKKMFGGSDQPAEPTVTPAEPTAEAKPEAEEAAEEATDDQNSAL